LTLESIRVEPPPLLRVACFATHFPAPLGDLAPAAEILAWLRPDASTPL
jgi:hypothetical protein